MTTNGASIITMDPRDDGPQAPARLAQRPATLDGKVIGLFANNKPSLGRPASTHRGDHRRAVRHRRHRGAQQGRLAVAGPHRGLATHGQEHRRGNTRHR